ncbi:zinc finger MYM-type protein 1-like [Coffea eugenioides]|uniref:zinc finger MYM-type protein 1-like n=1 Tax=Coffea eugenioides TaxID=49369 RepID=UPI000F6049C9|nr:zinc finger MYM-type protein 1-like [Coffea eugenioides]
MKAEYRTRLLVSVDCARFLLHQGLVFVVTDITNALASETTSIIVNDIGHGLFAILCDESCDASTKEQLAVVIRYVDLHGYVIEHFLGILHVSDATALSLKKAIDVLFSKHGLSISQIRGQGYDSASNMRGEYSGLKTLIMKENGSAYYIHCFAHQLQLSVVGVAKKHVQVSSMYNTLSTLVHFLEDSSKRQEILREQ